MQRLTLLAALLGLFFGHAAVAQQNVTTCSIDKIAVAKSATEMTKRLNESLSCIEKRLQTLEQNEKSITNRADASVNYPTKAVAGGIEAVINTIVLSSDKRIITAEISLKNTIDSPILLTLVRKESNFNIPGMSGQYAINAKGLYNCLYDTARCKSDDDSNWSSLQPDQYAALQIPYPIAANSKAKTASLQFRLLVKIGEYKQPYDFSFKDISFAG